MAASHHLARRELALPLLVIAVAVALGWYVTRDREMPVERSAMGSQGLVTVLRAGGLDARYGGFGPIPASDVGLRILPVLDTDPGADFAPPDTREAYLKTGTERDLPARILRRKVQLAPTLVVAPKWTRAARLSGYAHPSLLLEADEAAAPFGALAVHIGQIGRPGGGLLSVPVSYSGGGSGTALLYAAQLFAPPLPSGCEPILSAPGGQLAISCSVGARQFFALSDPDLLNNHGLALGDNAAIAVDLIAGLAGGDAVIVDTTDTVFVTEAEPPLERRGWTDLVRFFAYPLAVAWAGLAAILVLGLWRAWVRFGKPLQIYDSRPGASQSASIAAKARILRMAGNDSRLFEDYIDARLRRLERQLFGGAHPQADPVARIVALVRARDETLAAGFARSAAGAIAPSAQSTPSRLLAVLAEFDHQAKRVLNEFGRV